MGLNGNDARKLNDLVATLASGDESTAEAPAGGSWDVINAAFDAQPRLSDDELRASSAGERARREHQLRRRLATVRETVAVLPTLEDQGPDRMRA